MSLVHKALVIVTTVALSFQLHSAAPYNAVKHLDYWKSGGAEVSVYELSQHRYSDLHKGQLITIMVKEDFLTEKQVKNESYTSKSSTPILKRIELRKFTTGLYDYSTFTSVFTPLDRTKFPHALKATSSVQEWCGTTFLQLNWKPEGYTAQNFSYFEAEGDRTANLGEAVLEDDLFNQIRFAPTKLPVGQFRFVPTLSLLQTQHYPLKSYQAHSILTTYPGKEFHGNDLQSYSVQQPELKRSLEIVFEAKPPHKIVGWKDSYPSVSDGKIRTTTVTLKSQKNLEYWNMSRLSDQKLREELGIK